MPICRHCKSRISKLDKDRCPICGELNPLDGVTSDTVEITTDIDLSSEIFSDYKPKKRKVFLLLSCLIGWLGMQFFYLKFYKMGLVWLACNLLIAVGGFLGFFFGVNSLVLAIVIPLAVLYVANITLGLLVFNRPSIKDAEGNLLK